MYSRLCDSLGQPYTSGISILISFLDKQSYVFNGQYDSRGYGSTSGAKFFDKSLKNYENYVKQYLEPFS